MFEMFVHGGWWWHHYWNNPWSINGQPVQTATQQGIDFLFLMFIAIMLGSFVAFWIYILLLYAKKAKHKILRRYWKSRYRDD